ncbi:DNA primase [Enterococcus avium]|uniref:DNA primase n=2 Tax=Enterococcus TaxID=1350 RepID=UPI0016213363|nr:DNA primase [Enterococcus avium]
MTDGVLMGHLDRTRTVGILLGTSGLTKFMSFDVDIKDEVDAKITTQELVRVLNEYYGIDREDIHVSISGSKGYHVDLYFDKVISESELIPFYEEVLEILGESSRRIERRPTKGHGIKLPLGVHRKTGSTCFYVDNMTLTPLPVDYFLSIVPMSLENFKEYILVDFESENEKEIGTNVSLRGIKSVDTSKIDGLAVKREVLAFLRAGHLLSANTRNDMTFFSAIFLKSQGHSLVDTKIMIEEKILNTYDNPNTRKLIDKKMTRDKLIKETKRVIEVVYEKNYSIRFNTRPTIIFYQSEIQLILSLPDKWLQHLLFSLLYMSKKYSNESGEFYCAYSVLMEQGNGKNRGRISGRLQTLEKLGYISILSIGRLMPNGLNTSNVYKVNINPDENKEVCSYPSQEFISWEEVLEQYSMAKDMVS